MSYKNDPRRMSARFNSTCKKCNKPIKKGEPIIYWPSGSHAEHEACGEAEYSQFRLSAQDEDNYNRGYGY